MKNHIAIIALTLLVAGCASNPKQKPVHEQGWIGGRYKWAKDGRGAAGILFGNDYPTIYSFPRSLQPAQPAGVQARAHARDRDGDVMRQDSSGSVPSWRLSKTSKA